MAHRLTKVGGGVIKDRNANGLLIEETKCGGQNLDNGTDGNMLVTVSAEGARDAQVELKAGEGIHTHLPDGIYQIRVQHAMPIKGKAVAACYGPDSGVVPAQITSESWCSGHSFTLEVTESRPRLALVMYLMSAPPGEDDGNIGADGSGNGYGDEQPASGTNG